LRVTLTAYRGAVPLVWILTPGALFLTCGQVVGNLLGGRNHPGIVARTQGLALISTLALLFALLPFLGVYAAAIASTIAYGISAPSCFTACCACPRLPASPQRLERRPRSSSRNYRLSSPRIPPRCDASPDQPYRPRWPTSSQEAIRPTYLAPRRLHAMRAFRSRNDHCRLWQTSRVIPPCAHMLYIHTLAAASFSIMPRSTTAQEAKLIA
jgi:hypothetical protein